MFSGFWSWVLVVLIVAAIIYADKLPAFREVLKSKVKSGVEVAKEKKKAIEEKVNKKIHHNEKDKE